jgi:hypothetical protein
MYGWIGRQISKGDLYNYLHKNRQTEGQSHTYGHMDSIWKYGQTNRELDNRRQIDKGQMDRRTGRLTSKGYTENLHKNRQTEGQRHKYIEVWTDKQKDGYIQSDG